MKLSSLKICIALLTSFLILTLSSTVTLATEASTVEDRWFEVEVILFNQLGDKHKLMEKFPTHANLPQYDQVDDILSPFLHPDIAALKQQLPSCEASEEERLQQKQTLAQQAISQFTQQQINTLFTEKSINEINRLETSTLEMSTLETDSSEDDTSEKSILEENKLTPQSENISELPSLNKIVDTSNISDVQPLDTSSLNKSNINGENLTIQTEIIDLSEQEQALVNDAEKYFSQQVLVNYQQYPNISKQNLCAIPTSFFIALKEKGLLDKTYNENAYITERTPRTIDATGQHTDNSPYLMSADDLQLTDIVKRLGWSKNFKPLLHIGWRQTPVTRTESIPLHLFAGENLEYQYQQALKQYEQKLNNEALKIKVAENTAELQTPVLPKNSLNNHDLSNNKLQLSDNQENIQLIEQSRNQSINADVLAKQNYLTQLFTDIETLSEDDIKPLIIDTQKMLLTDKSAQNIFADKSIIALPEKPSQPWFLDGFFKVHLDHYLYITADFGIYNKNRKSGLNQAVDTIAFKQDRRVISSEIHYFDHPYIGMIVQIRRYTPPEPNDELTNNEINKKEN